MGENTGMTKVIIAQRYDGYISDIFSESCSKMRLKGLAENWRDPEKILSSKLKISLHAFQTTNAHKWCLSMFPVGRIVWRRILEESYWGSGKQTPTPPSGTTVNIKSNLISKSRPQNLFLLSPGLPSSLEESDQTEFTSPLGQVLLSFCLIPANPNNRPGQVFDFILFNRSGIEPQRS